MTTVRTEDEGFADIVKAFGDEPGVTEPEPAGSARRFGSPALRVNGLIFAMVSHGRLVLKPPSGRVAQLIASGGGGTYGAGKRRPLREWVSLNAATQDNWLDLATEALEFVRSSR